MRIPPDMMSEARTAFYFHHPLLTDLGLENHAQVIAEWARKEALREAAEDYGTPGMTAPTQYVKEWLRDRADRVGGDKTDD